MSPNTPQKTHVYVDGFNLYYGAVRKTPYKWLDLAKLCNALLPNDQIESIKYFTAKVSSRPGDPDQPIRQQLYLRALNTIPNLTIIYGHFLTHSRFLPESDSNPIRWVKVNITEEKGSDVNLASYLLHDGFKELYDVAAIISNDSDLREPVRMVKEVLGLQVGIINPHSRHSKELQEYATFVKRIRKSHLAMSQFPETITDSKGTFSKPTIW